MSRVFINRWALKFFQFNRKKYIIDYYERPLRGQSICGGSAGICFNHSFPLKKMKIPIRLNCSKISHSNKATFVSWWQIVGEYQKNGLQYFCSLNEDNFKTSLEVLKADEQEILTRSVILELTDESENKKLFGFKFNCWLNQISSRYVALYPFNTSCFY